MSRKTEMLPGAQAAGGGTSGIGFTLVNPLPGVRSLWAVFVAAVLQRLPFALLPPDSFVAVKKTLLVLSYLLLVWALSRNLQFRSVRLILVGVLLNFAAIVANGGLMPVSPEARALAGMTDLGEFVAGQRDAGRNGHHAWNRPDAPGWVDGYPAGATGGCRVQRRRCHSRGCPGALPGGTHLGAPEA